MKYKQLLVNASMVIASLAAPVANATPTGTATYDRVTVVEEGTGTWWNSSAGVHEGELSR